MSQAALFDVDPHVRRAFDYYPTPRWMTQALLRRLWLRGTLLECCSGEDAIADVLRAYGKVYTNDADLSRPAQMHKDATDPAAWASFPAVDWVVTNPPFALADQIVPLALAHARLGAVMLLRLSWAEPTEARADWLARHPYSLIVLPRHDWRGNGSTDSVTSAWFVWLADEGVRRYRGFPNSTVTKAERDELIAQERAA